MEIICFLGFLNNRVIKNLFTSDFQIAFILGNNLYPCNPSVVNIEDCLHIWIDGSIY